MLLSRLSELDPELPESLLRPKAPVFEYWGHEASWLPMELYPVFAFRRQEFRQRSPWWGPVLQENRAKARAVLRRVRDEGPMRSADFEDDTGRSDWGYTLTRRILRCLWWAGDLAVRERRNFQPYYDVTERVIPDKARESSVPRREATKILLLKALDGHGWAQTKTLVDTWRLTKRRKLIQSCLDELAEEGEVVACSLDGRSGWIRRDDLELAARLGRARPSSEAGVLLSPFDPILWDRARVKRLFDFDHVLEIFKPAKERKYGYYSMPVVAGDRLVARCDAKADRSTGTLRVLATHHESDPRPAAVRSALSRHARSLKLRLEPSASRLR